MMVWRLGWKRMGAATAVVMLLLGAALVSRLGWGATVRGDTAEVVAYSANVYQIETQVFVAGFDWPTALTHAGDERLFVVERAGRIMIVEDGVILPEPFLDITEHVSELGDEQGMVSLAFHPNYTSNGHFFVNYTNLDGTTIVSRYTVSATDPNMADPASEKLILVVPQPTPFHNGADMKFGPDGYLYIGMGDGGPFPGDPLDNAQNPGNLLGTILRLDIDNGNPYAIPPDNPFVGNPAFRAEIWAYGLRNPWRFSFDTVTGDFFMADVGEWVWEELNYQPAGDPGGQNYGWRCWEGNHPYDYSNCSSTAVPFEFPVLDYGHVYGCAIVAGHVYRGVQHPEFSGDFFLADFCAGRISSFEWEDGSWEVRGEGSVDSNVPSLGEDVNGELYIVGGREGTIYTMSPGNLTQFTFVPGVFRQE